MNREAQTNITFTAPSEHPPGTVFDLLKQAWVWVTTTDEDFFIPAQRTYESCGFQKVRKTEDNNLEYELEL